MKKIMLIFSSFNFSHGLGVNNVKVDALAQQKNSKRHFLKDIENSFQEITHWSRTSPVIFFLKYLNKYGR